MKALEKRRLVMGNEMISLLSFTPALSFCLFCLLCNSALKRTVVMKVAYVSGSAEDFLLADSFLTVEQVAEASAETLKLAIITSEV